MAPALMASGEKNSQTSIAASQAKLKGYYGNISEKQFRRYYKERTNAGAIRLKI